jgi:uncharacterized GH25 family protein
MIKAKSIVISVIATSTLLASFYTQAHGIWFAERSRNLALIYGEGAEDLEILKRQQKIEAFQGFNNNWEKVDSALKPSGPLLLVDNLNSVSAVSAVMNNGIWSKLKDGSWVSKGRDQAPDATLSERTYKYAVHLRGELRKVPELKNQKLQILPVGSEFPTLRGETAKFKVLFNGKPAKKAKVVVDFINDPDSKHLYANDRGEVIITIRNQGLNVIAAIFDGPADDPKIVDKIEHLATLSFVLPHEPE